MKNIAIIFAGGVGARMNNPETPKQFLVWNGKAVLIHTLLNFEKNENIDAIILACKEDWIDYARSLIEKENINKVCSIVPGGDTALDSQYIALKKAKELYGERDIIVLIHDGVRPLIDDEIINRNIEGVKKKGSAITVTKAIETVVLVNKNAEVSSVLDRDSCVMAKAPQSFWLRDILDAHNIARKKGVYNYVDSASLMLASGFTLNTVMGKHENIKITTPSDYYMFLGISRARLEE
ncbi:IspD/TarI family cytidylyltransferase [Gallibacterium genomosp. 1]|uniref:2-C-methyl-D-erythritol 4-phosphate cytidylyltransferase n=1 Tax=Gallibacterium genomosp. 1 TaxID=155515 RepID=A0AB36DVB3_9PAST|nr:IspD/TarI family cytidylyltransferase [Gallibacterium genomosp. 1]OBX00319.1 2-C-methyl-D-erythritol 4-phosphate cytidylyltransferase [Gallibacterium genomosp. 1]OBX00352.1 2-C-methyl-D-erythritol 4-phosphate cytidylyltransferase [Gallibacterium genomosp. 1]